MRLITLIKLQERTVNARLVAIVTKRRRYFGKYKSLKTNIAPFYTKNITCNCDKNVMVYTLLLFCDNSLEISSRYAISEEVSRWRLRCGGLLMFPKAFYR